MTNRILCLGTRNGREIDVFRLVLCAPLYARLAALAEVRSRGGNSLLPFLEMLGRSDISIFEARGAIGLEMNPQGARKNITIGSFDNLPERSKDSLTSLISALSTRRWTQYVPQARGLKHCGGVAF